MGSHRENPDALLVEECLSGSQHAWSEFYHRFLPLVRSTVRRQKGLNSSDIDDLTQNIFLHLVDGLNDYDTRYSLPRFVCRVAERTCIDEYRGLKAAKRHAPTDPIDHHDGGEEGSLTIQALGESQEDELSRAQIAAVLRKALKSLGSRCRDLLSMRYYEELPYRRISEVFHATDNTLTVQVRRCIEELRAVWDELMRTGVGR